MKETCWNSQSSHSVWAPVTSEGPQASAGETANAFSPSLKAARSVIVALIPAYRPGQVLIDTVKAIASGDWEAIVIVDDGSGPAYASIFAELGRLPNVDVVSHAVNLGKGAALKTGINFILCAYPEVEGIVTVDADGQHDPADIQNVSETFHEAPDALVLGVRNFKGHVPLRSWVGNQITRRVMHAVVGPNLSDSQTGLRAIPRALLPRLLKVPASGYEFELEMLIGVKHLGLRLIEQPIRTIYEPGNPSSHFRPLLDSMRIYYVLLRFALIGLMAAALDNAIFYILFPATGNILGSLIGARVASVLFNYAAVRRAVFLSEERHRIVLPRYLSLVATNMVVAYTSIRFLVRALSWAVFPAKILTETLLFIVNFAVQRDFIFTSRTRSPLPAAPSARSLQTLG